MVKSESLYIKQVLITRWKMAEIKMQLKQVLNVTVPTQSIYQITKSILNGNHNLFNRANEAETQQK